MKQKIILSTNFKRNYVAAFAVSLFLLIVAGEVVLAVSIPAYMNRENAMALQVAKLRFLGNFDMARGLTNKVQGKDETLLLEKKLLSCVLDEMAVVLRKNADKLTMEEMDELNRVVLQAVRVAQKLRKGQPFSKTFQFNTEAYIHSLLQQNKQGVSHEQK